MHRGTMLVALIAALAGCCTFGGGQEEPAAPAEMDDTEALMAMLEQMGAPAEARLMFRIMSYENTDPMALMMLMAMAKGGAGGIDDDFLFLNMFMGGGPMGGTAPERRATAIDGDTLYIIGGGIVTRVNLATMQVEGTTAYRTEEKPTFAQILRELTPLIQEVRAERERWMEPGAVVEPPMAKAKMGMMPAKVAEGPMPVELGEAQQTCQIQAIMLAQAALAYAKEHDNQLPGEDWREALAPYVDDDEEVARCPLMPELDLAYAYNDSVAGLSLADLADPENTVLFFECDTAIEEPVAGPASLVARHNGTVVVGFANGDARAIPVDQAMQRLVWNPLAE